MRPFSNVLCGAFLILSLNLGSGQGIQPVRWHFQWDRSANHEITVTLTAVVAPGWHVYSQFMEEGGPVPTRVSFDPSDDYAMAGKTEEKGNRLKFHDDTYEMEIVWYTAQVSFLQRIRLIQPAARVNGVVEYMACNDHICVPRKQDFNIAISPLEKSP